MSYTSEQYKYLLMKRLQRHFSMKSAKERAYTQSFFWKLFDESVTVTEEAYDNFVSMMDEQLAYLAEKNVYLCEDIPQSAIEERSILLINAFEEIGVTLVIDSETDSSHYLATFTKPDGEILTYKVGKMANLNYFYVNCSSGCEYQYARASAPAYNMRDMEVLGADEIDPKIAGPGTYWSYDADTAAVTVTGDGAYAGATKEEQLGSGAYTTVILGANVSRLLADSLEDSAITTVVLLHGADAPLTLDSEVVDKKNAKEWTVYADNGDFRNFAWPSSVKITWHTLAEWEG